MSWFQFEISYFLIWNVFNYWLFRLLQRTSLIQRFLKIFKFFFRLQTSNILFHCWKPSILASSYVQQCISFFIALLWAVDCWGWMGNWTRSHYGYWEIVFLFTTSPPLMFPAFSSCKRIKGWILGFLLFRFFSFIQQVYGEFFSIWPPLNEWSSISNNTSPYPSPQKYCKTNNP